MKELSILKTIRHHAIMEVKEILCDENNFYVASEICEGGELYDRLKSCGKLSEENAGYVMK